jgi:hypothetical protein
VEAALRGIDALSALVRASGQVSVDLRVLFAPTGLLAGTAPLQGARGIPEADGLRVL